MCRTRGSSRGARVDRTVDVSTPTKHLHSSVLVVPLVLEDEENDRRQALRTMITYESVRFPIYLDDSSETNRSVEQNEENPIMRVHEDGRVHGVAATSEILR